MQPSCTTIMELNNEKLMFLGLALAGCCIVSLISTALQRGLREIPGPWIAKFNPFWRVGFVWKGNAHIDYRNLHDKYGPIVRTAPNVVDISDPAVLPSIYAIGSKFVKVCPWPCQISIKPKILIH